MDYKRLLSYKVAKELAPKAINKVTSKPYKKVTNVLGTTTDGLYDDMVQNHKIRVENEDYINSIKSSSNYNPSTDYPKIIQAQGKSSESIVRTYIRTLKDPFSNMEQ